MRIKINHLKSMLITHIENEIKYISTQYLINVIALYQKYSCACTYIINHVENHINNDSHDYEEFNTSIIIYIIMKD